jgi:hypothetical protein
VGKVGCLGLNTSLDIPLGGSGFFGLILLFSLLCFLLHLPAILHQGVQYGVSAFRLRHLAGPVCSLALHGVFFFSFGSS